LTLALIVDDKEDILSYLDIIHNVLGEVVDKYEKLVLRPPPIGIKLIPKDLFIEDAKNNKLNQMLIDVGAFEDFGNEYPSFLVVYYMDKHPLNLILTGKFWIGVCLEIAEVQLNKLTNEEGYIFLSYALAHEITHIMENTIQEKLPKVYAKAWNKCPITDNAQKKLLVSETLAEDIASKFADKHTKDLINNKLWGVIMGRLRG
jgi:hypothetical protein